jgi:hypothetical protein
MAPERESDAIVAFTYTPTTSNREIVNVGFLTDAQLDNAILGAPR